MTDEATKSETNAAVAAPVDGLVMREYSQGVCDDGAAILCDGEQLNVEQILRRLRTLEVVRAMIYDAPELNINNFDDADAELLNDAVCEIWQTIETDA